MTFIVAVVGNLYGISYGVVAENLDRWIKLGWTIVSGGAVGVDSHAKRWAILHHVKYYDHLPEEYIEKEFFARNRKVAQDAHYMLCFICLGQYQAGTWNTLRQFLHLHPQYKFRFEIWDEYGIPWSEVEYPTWLQRHLRTPGRQQTLTELIV